MNRITHDPDMCGGRACVRGMRIMVADVLGWLAAGMDTEEILRNYPEVEPEDIRACLEYAAAQVNKYRVSPSSAPAP